jgi:hypothetical protein
MTKVYQTAYLVRYLRLGETFYFISLDRTSAEEYAMKHHGIISRMYEHPPSPDASRIAYTFTQKLRRLFG